jgi:hypothetical protein
VVLIDRRERIETYLRDAADLLGSALVVLDDVEVVRI